MENNESKKPGAFTRLRHLLIGEPKKIDDPSLYQKISLVALLAWIGLGADGLSSSSYGPEIAYKALGSHTYLAVFLGLATALSVFIISYAYTRIIEQFPHGGGGYIVATQFLGKRVGAVSGSALILGYVLTITVSIVSCVDAIFSYLPMQFHEFKVPAACLLVILMIVLNLRGVKESIVILAPIFIVFIITHIVMLLYGVFAHSDKIQPLAREIHGSLQGDLSTIGWVGIMFVFLRAFSLGGGTYTGLEAVSNGMQIMREPKVQTGKKTMLYMAVSLAFTAGMLFFCYSILGVHPVEGRTLNSVLADGLFAGWPLGKEIAFITILSEGALLLVGAQTGFVGGPQVMANMAIDSWLPHRFSSLSERLTMQNGIVIMGLASVLLVFYTHGSISALVVMYSINVFITFTLSNLGMARLFFKHRDSDPLWRRHLSVSLLGLVVCLTILTVIVVVKFTEGSWLTLMITLALVGFCTLIRSHYHKVTKSMAKLDEIFKDLPTPGPYNNQPLRHGDQTAIQLVGGYTGFGIHTLLSITTKFPNTFKNIIFISVGVVDSGSFKGADAAAALERSVKESLEKYVNLARRLGYPADYRMEVATDVVESAVNLCESISKEYPQSVVFTGQITFRLEKFYHKLLHNETAFAIQRRLHWNGITSVILPIREA